MGQTTSQQPTSNKKRFLSFNSIKNRLIFNLSLITLIILLSFGAFYWYLTENGKISTVSEELNVIESKVQKARNLEKDFLVVEAFNPSFYESGKSQYVQHHRQIMDEIKQDIIRLEVNKDLTNKTTAKHIGSTIQKIDQYNLLFNELVQITLKRGFKNYGFEGDMQKAMSQILKANFPLDIATIAQIRSYEKDYLVQKDTSFIPLFEKELASLYNSVDAKVADNSSRTYIKNTLDNYETAFLNVVESDKKIGFQRGDGLWQQVNNASNQVEGEITTLKSEINDLTSTLKNQINTTIIILLVCFILLVITISYLLTNRMSNPMQRLANSIKNIVDSDFDTEKSVYLVEKQDEVGTLSQNIHQMLQKVKEKNIETNQQKETIADAYENVKILQEVGHNVTAHLMVDNIAETLFKNIKGLFDANIFLLGAYDPQEDFLELRGQNSGVPIPNFKLSDDDTEQLVVWCFNMQKEVITGDFVADFGSEYVKNQKELSKSSDQSIICIPLTTKNERLGIILIQSDKKDAYDEYQINLFRNLTVYTTSALENALNYQKVEMKVVERTAVITEQKEKIELQNKSLEKAFHDIKLLGEIGGIITSYLSLERITNKVYEYINDLMDAPIFGIGIYHEEQGKLEVIGSIENYKRMEKIEYEINDPKSYAAWCVRHQKEIIINNLFKEYQDYLNDIQQLHTEKGIAQSVIFLPLFIKERVVGMISVQSLNTDAYSENQVNLLRTFSTYIAVAIENARAYTEIETKNTEIEESSKKLRQSIQYAKRIQDAILPNINEIKRALPDSFILFKPKDIVSGDFYWFAEKDDKVLIAAFDCTGHGVPGAFMSMIGNNLLHKIVVEMGILHPDNILDELHHGIRTALKQDDTQNRDGMDAAICVIDKKKKTLEYSGAHSPLFFIQKDKDDIPQLYRVKGNRAGVGGIRKEMYYQEFTRHEINITETVDQTMNGKAIVSSNDIATTVQVDEATYTTFYIFSDGYQDQIGGPDDTKFYRNRFRQLLYDIHQEPMERQEQILNETIEDWINHNDPKNKQLDDMLVIGVRVYI